uniref:Uncharacterized protein n=1 Tax=Rhizophora mucronata TaxID=61149 RepID=A0A2P2PMW1_RHIMU
MDIYADADKESKKLVCLVEGGGETN